MKKKNLLSKAEMKKILGGGLPGEDLGSCTFTSGNASCTSSSGDCKYLYCVSGSNTTAIGICCDGVQYKQNPNVDCTGSETKECRA